MGQCMIKPYTIKKVEVDPEGNSLVSVSITKRSSGDSETGVKIEVHDNTMDTFLVVPPGQDIDTYLINYFKETGWL